MREIRTYGSEGGEAGNGLPYPYPAMRTFFAAPSHGEKLAIQLLSAKESRQN